MQRLLGFVIGGCLLAMAYTLWPFWREVPRDAGLDFYHYWGIAHARTLMPQAQANPYRYPVEYKTKLAAIALASNDRTLQAVHQAKSFLDLTNTPLLYVATRLLPNQYAHALSVYRCIQMLAIATGMLTLWRSLGIGKWRRAILWSALLMAAYDPLVVDLRFANLASVQLLGLVFAIALSLRTAQRSRLALLVLGGWLPALTFLKPNLLLPMTLLGIGGLRQAPRNLRLPFIAVAIAAAAVCVEIGSLYFASPVIWIDWARVLFSHDGRLGYAYALGNYSFSNQLSLAGHWPLLATSSVLTLGGLIILVGVPWALSQVTGRQVSLMPTANAATWWASVGLVITLGGAPLVWAHYYVWALIPIVYLVAGANQPWLARFAGGLGFVGCAGMLRAYYLNVVGAEPDWLPLVNCLGWAPLAVGLFIARVAPARPA
ncbi:MAG: hypothetical protein HYX63_02645 [Gammaproteobacteria bacterium]|nr:hypothetical protein [Gammaproteobacteria bacterium]